METVHLQAGAPLIVRFEHAMWRADVGNQHFCSQTREGLLRVLSEAFPVMFPQPDTSAPKLDVFAVFERSTSLKEKQEALLQIQGLAAQGNQRAKAIVDAVRSKPLSPAAQNLVLKLGKDDFSLVTHEELVEHSIKNLPERNKLILELADRLKV